MPGRLARLLLISAVCLLWAASTLAQPISASRIVLGTAPCVFTAGSGAPTGGAICDTYWRTDTGQLYVRGASDWGTFPSTAVSNTWTAEQVFQRATGTDVALSVYVTGDTYPRARFTADGVLAFGSGSVAVDTNLYRGGANTVQTDDTLTVGVDVMPETGYAGNIGALTKKWLTLHAAELWVETLVAQSTIATIGGRILVGPTTPLAADCAAADDHIHVKYNNLTNGDRVYLEANGAVEFLAITSAASGGAGNYSYSVTRNLDGSGANDWTAGDAVFDTGTTGNGFIDLYSVRGVSSATEIGPTIVGNRRNSATYNDWSPYWAIGRLDGLYGYTSTACGGSPCFGAGFGVPSARHLVIDPSNGVRILDNTTTRLAVNESGIAMYDTGGTLRANFTDTYVAFYADANTYGTFGAAGISLVSNSVTKVSIGLDGTATFGGTVNATAGYFGDGSTRVAIEAAGINIGNTGSIRGGQTAYATGTGFWLGYDSTAYKFSIGVAGTGNRLLWDGTNLKIVSANLTIDDNGIQINPTTTESSTRAYRFTDTANAGLYYYKPDGLDERMWLYSPGKLDLRADSTVFVHWDYDSGDWQGSLGFGLDGAIIGQADGGDNAKLGSTTDPFASVYATTFYQSNGTTAYGGITGTQDCSAGGGWVESFQVYGGIVGGTTVCGGPGVLISRIDSLEQEVAALKVLVASFAATPGSGAR